MIGYFIYLLISYLLCNSIPCSGFAALYLGRFLGREVVDHGLGGFDKLLPVVDRDFRGVVGEGFGGCDFR